MSQPLPLRPDAPALEEFASDLAACAEGPISARDLAEAYLDNALADDFDGDFDAAVTSFVPQCAYYADPT